MKHIFSIILASFITCASLFSLTNIPDPQPDFSGDYVYYKDNTFKEDTYIGFLYYDDATYGVRYFSKAKDIMVLFSINPNMDHLELTGEKITTTITQEDTETINYIHDMFYELFARRQKKEAIVSKQIFGSELNDDWQDYPQFGGTVIIQFSKIIPIFNIYAITDFEGKKLLETVTIGSLSSSEDKSFENFKGFSSLAKKTAKKVKAPKQNQVFTYSFPINPQISQSLNLDSLWLKQYDNVFALSQAQDTVITLSYHPFNADLADFIADAFLRQLLQSKNGAYSDFSTLKFSQKNESFNLAFDQIFTDNKLSYRQNSIVSLINNSTFACMNSHIESNFYQTNKAYFDKIFSSYKN